MWTRESLPEGAILLEGACQRNNDGEYVKSNINLNLKSSAASLSLGSWLHSHLG